MSEEGGKGGLVELRDSWLWRWGIRSWLFIGVIAAIVVIWGGYTKAHEVLLPLIVAFIIGILLRPFVESMVRHRFPRWLAVVVTMILIIAVLFGIFALLIYGVTTQAHSISRQVKSGVTRLQSWFDNLKVSDSFYRWLHDAIQKAWPQVADGLIHSVSRQVPGIASFAIGGFIAFFILIFFLGDDGRIPDWVAGHLPVARKRADLILQGVAESIRGYFRGTLIVATVDAILFIPIALILRLPLVWTIVVVTGITCFIPSFGGYIGGAFAVFIALAAKGPAAAIIMLVYAILVHTIMQNPVQAVAYGKTLNLHPLVALLVTLLGAVFAGIPGAILAVPVTAAVLKVTAEVRAAREGEGPAEESGPPAEEPA
jgi:predicted PurR-regulated permease PerM